jgi:hypothetical protein
MTTSCRTRPAGVSSVKPSCQWHDGSEKRCASLTRRAGVAGFATVRLAESPIACACASAIGPRGVPLAPRWVRAGRGVEGGARHAAALVRGAGQAEPQDVGGMTKSCRARPAGGGHAFGAPAGRARQDLRPSGWRRALRPAAWRLRPSARAGCHWHPAGAGRGLGWRGAFWVGGFHPLCGSGVRNRRMLAV